MSLNWPNIFETAFLGTGSNTDFPSEDITYTQGGSDTTITAIVDESTDDAPTNRMSTNVRMLSLKISRDDLSSVKVNSDRITRNSKVYVVQGIVEKSPMCWHILAVSM